MPFTPEVHCYAGLRKIGAIFIPIFAGYAPRPSIAARLNDGGAKVLIDKLMAQPGVASPSP